MSKKLAEKHGLTEAEADYVARHVKDGASEEKVVAFVKRERVGPAYTPAVRPPADYDDLDVFDADGDDDDEDNEAFEGYVPEPAVNVHQGIGAAYDPVANPNPNGDPTDPDPIVTADGTVDFDRRLDEETELKMLASSPDLGADEVPTGYEGDGLAAFSAQDPHEGETQPEDPDAQDSDDAADAESEQAETGAFTPTVTPDGVTDADADALALTPAEAAGLEPNEPLHDGDCDDDGDTAVVTEEA